MRRTTTWILLLGALVGVSFLVFQIAFEPSSEVDPTSSSTKVAEEPVADPALVGRPFPARPSTEPERGLPGVVHDETGRGVAGVRVVAIRTSSPTVPEPSPHALVFARMQATTRRGVEVAHATSGSDGQLVLRGLDATEDHEIEARPEAPRVGAGHHVPGGAWPKAPIVLVVRQGHPLRLRVVGAAGEGLEAVVTVLASSFQELRRTGGDGRVTFASVRAGVR